jgi:ADP-heptose:LPS heptosyltransferase
MLGARRTAGTYVPGACRPDPQTFIALDERASEVTRCLAVLASLGVPPAGEELELHPLERDHRQATALLERAGASGALADGYAIVHAGGRSARRWPPARFAAVADALSRDIPIVLTGTPDERDAADTVLDRMRRPAVDVVGSTSMAAMFALVARARVVVCNDTGISHVADALGVPSVVLYTSADPARWAPSDRDLHRMVAADANDANAVVSRARELLVSSPNGSAR